MTETLPAPLTAADSDLQDFPFMPLHVARLRDSDMASEESPEACWYGVLLWAASWHQLPAGSLPDNDAVLTKLIGLGRDVRTFTKHKAGALRGFVKCSDGRLYHPVVAEQVAASWEGKLQQRWRTELARIKKVNQRTGADLPSPTYEEFLAAMSTGTPAKRPAHVHRDTDECPPGQGVQEKGTETGIKDNPPTPLEGGQHEHADAEGTASRRKPKRPIPDGFPSTEDIAAAQAQARAAGADVDMAYQAERFRNWAAGADHRYADWPKTWGNWVLRTVKEAPKRRPAAVPAPTPAGRADRWRRAMRTFKQTEYWNTTDDGPKPSKPGCLVPADVLIEFGFSPPPPEDGLFAAPAARSVA